jgi:uncharacterized protein (TIGR00730 family)
MERISALKSSPAYQLAFEDAQFLHRDQLRPNRMELEVMKATIVQDELGVRSTIALFGSARIPSPEDAHKRLDAARRALEAVPEDEDARQWVRTAERVLAKSRYYEVARDFARLVSAECQADSKLDYVICTGGGPGIMEAGNRGAADVGARSVGLNITLPHEQFPNSYISPELCFQFRYFAIRKIHFLMRAKALVVFPGGFGTMDELFETLTLAQTGKIRRFPIVLCGREFWERAVDFQFLVEEGVIGPGDLGLFTYAESAAEIWEAIRAFYRAGELKAPRTRQVP